MQLERTELENLMMAVVGLETMAYIKPIQYGALTQYAVFAADGTQLALFDTAENAYESALRHNLNPSSIH